MPGIDGPVWDTLLFHMTEQRGRRKTNACPVVMSMDICLTTYRSHVPKTLPCSCLARSPLIGPKWHPLFTAFRCVFICPCTYFSAISRCNQSGCSSSMSPTRCSRIPSNDAIGTGTGSLTAENSQSWSFLRAKNPKGTENDFPSRANYQCRAAVLYLHM